VSAASGSPESPPEPDAEAEAEAAALARAADAGIQRLPIPTPFAVGRINAYLIEDEPLTLVDSGPNSASALDELERALAAHGHAIEDLDLLIVTHQHIDHLGLAKIVARRSRAEVAALDLLAPYLERFAESMDGDDRYAGRVMSQHGVPAEVSTALRTVSAIMRAWGSGVTVTRPLADGDALALRNRALRVLHRPGHSPSDTLFWDEQRSLVLGGDHLIKRISSNPLIARPLGSPPDYSGPRPQALVTYLASLRATRAMDVEIVLPGHGEPVTHHAALIEERFRLHRRRAETMLRLIGERPRTAYEIAQALWGSVAITQAYLTVSEVLGHVDLLLNDGRVREVEEDGIVRFEALAG
jgi:glyoxylase-like metal-dependent hydrolase (beta-lactamase superfamily II)